MRKYQRAIWTRVERGKSSWAFSAEEMRGLLDAAEAGLRHLHYRRAAKVAQPISSLHAALDVTSIPALGAVSEPKEGA